MLVFISLVDLFLYLELAQGRRNRGVQGGAAAAPPDFENPEKLSHKNAIKLEFFEKWGKIGLLPPPLTSGARVAPELATLKMDLNRSNCFRF